MSTILIQQWPEPVQSVKRRTILETALQYGIPYPHSCRSGECGSCKTHLVRGEVDHDPFLACALSADEHERGYILACRCRPKTDIEIAWMEDDDAETTLPVRKFKATVSAIVPAAHNVVQLNLTCDDRFTFYAGQYARLGINDLPARSFSMANQPDEKALEFHIRCLSDGLVSGYVAQSLSVGDSVDIEGPFGTAYFRPQHDGPVIAIGGGTGLAPMLSIAQAALFSTPSRPVHLYFGVQAEKDIYAQSQLQQLQNSYPNLTIHTVLSSSNEQTTHRTGFVHQALESDFDELLSAKIYAAGPPPMIEAVTTTVLERGALSKNIHSDPFTAAESAESKRRLSKSIARFFGK